MEAVIEKTAEELAKERHARALAFSKMMVERKKETIKEMREEYKIYPEKMEAWNELMAENERRGSRVIRL